ncbi:MAG: ABC transporter ATP-binding protein [Chloroflexi bacterium]|nr:ABC transporter ATP-binding protein [Chloroflexota bacterium]
MITTPARHTEVPALTRVPRPALLAGTGLHKRFGRTEALRGIDLELSPGEIVAVMGPSGSGKSTLLHCLAGIVLPDEGTVTFDGRDLQRLGEGERSRLRRTSFGFIFQFGQLVPELLAIENVALPLLLNGIGRSRAEAIAAPWFGRLGIAGLERRRPGEMSGGQAQRIALARALVTEPAVVFADEPTGSLDSLAGEQVMELLTTAAAELGTSIVLVTHEPRVAAYAHREVVVRDGRVSGLEAA